MLKDIPYSVLQNDRRAYEIMLLRDQYDNTLSDIAVEFEISVQRVRQIYIRIKRMQRHLYINHLSVVLGYSDTSQIMKIFNDVEACYENRRYAIAYIENKYKDILTEYRDGEPGMPIQIIQSMPPFKPKFSENTIARVIEMRETQKATFVEIAKKLHMTQEKAKQIYDLYYHKKKCEIYNILQEKAKSKEEKEAIWDYCFRGNKSSKKIYDMLTKDIHS